MWWVAETAWLYVVVDGDRAGNGLVALSVADLDATLAELGRRGIARSGWRWSVAGGRRPCSTRTRTPWRSSRCAA